MIGTSTLEDSLHCPGEGGVVCMTGIVGNKWSFDQFAPYGRYPHNGFLSRIYAGESNYFMRTPLNDLAKQIEAGTLRIQVGKTFHIDEIVEAHRLMEENKKRAEKL